MKTLGQFLIERRKAQGLSQTESAALIKNRDGKPISATYLNYLEHDRGKPPDYLLDQFADVLKVVRDVLYFWRQRTPRIRLMLNLLRGGVHESLGQIPSVLRTRSLD